MEPIDAVGLGGRVSCSRGLRGFAAVLIGSALLSGALADVCRADDEPADDYPPGLLAIYSGGGREVRRVDPDVAFDWGPERPDVRLPSGPFTARWTGNVLVRTEGRYRLHVYTSGTVEVRLAGTVRVAGATNKPGWVDGEEFDLEFGEHPLEIEYTRGDRGLIWLGWSSTLFPLEPIPATLLFRDEEDAASRAFARGERLFEALRCAACHREAGAKGTALPAPSLEWAGRDLQSDWLKDWLEHPAKTGSQARMPDLGLGSDDAAAVAAALRSIVAAGQPAPVPSAGPTGPEVATAGELLFHSVGCLACHSRGEIGTNAVTGGGDLSNLEAKRSMGWVEAWLRDPGALNARHRMPVVPLSDEERRQLSVYLAGPPQPAKNGPAPGADLAARGRALITSTRCTACHEIPGFAASEPARGLSSAADWDGGCLGEPDLKTHRPGYRLNDEDRLAVREYVRGVADHGGGAVSAFERGRSVLAWQNCLACHERDGGRGIAPLAARVAQSRDSLKGQTEALLPPDLTAVGDKLHDAALSQAVSGPGDRLRLPWLRVRMPRFVHGDDDRAALVAYFTAHDRIPPREEAAGATSGRETRTGPGGTADSERLLAGEQLAGPKGFSCSACHALGTFEPRNVALGTRGSNLWKLGDRMRPAFFTRWVRSPIRIVPGMEMPSFERPHPEILAGRLDDQLAALWSALNEAPNPPRVDAPIERILAGVPGNPAVVVRDVVRWPHARGGEPVSVPRSIAAAFGSGVNLLLDLEFGSPRAAWTGPFLRQRAAGKTWYWEAAGPVRALLPPMVPAVVLRNGRGRVVSAQYDLNSGRNGELRGYQTELDRAGAGVLTLETRLNFVLPDGTTWTTELTELWRERLPTAGSHGGLERQVTIDPENLPDGWTPHVLLHDFGPLWTVENGEETGPRVSLVLADRREVVFETLAPGAWARWTSTTRISPATEGVAVPTHGVAVKAEGVALVPGFDGMRLPLPRSLMPTGIAVLPKGELAISSLRGEVFRADDSDADGVADRLTTLEESLAAPMGVLVDGNTLLVAHKPEILRIPLDAPGRAARVRRVFASGWGYSDDYHDWTCSPVRDSEGNVYVGLGSDYAQKSRPFQYARWRGKVLKIDPAGTVTPVGHAFRYPTGLAVAADDSVFVSDNQGVANTFNEINYLRMGARYGVPSLHEEPHAGESERAAIEVPHPWTRSVNGLVFLPPPGTAGGNAFGPFAGQGIGCEYDGRFLVRFSFQRVGEVVQGAVYPMSRNPGAESAGSGWLGTYCAAVSAEGELYIGSFHDSGWLGGPNVGEITRLRPNGRFPLGIREVRATATGFEIEFTGPVDPIRGAAADAYSVGAYTRVWEGAYATPDRDRHKPAMRRVVVSDDRRKVRLDLEGLRVGYVYELKVGRVGATETEPLWPSEAHFTLRALPR